MCVAIQEQVRDCIDDAVNYHNPRFKSYKHLCDHYNNIHGFIYYVVNLLCFTVGFLLTVKVTSGNTWVGLLSCVLILASIFSVHHYSTKWLTNFYSKKVSKMLNHYVDCDEQIIEDMYEKMEEFTESNLNRPEKFTIVQLQSILLIYQSIRLTKEKHKNQIASL